MQWGMVTFRYPRFDFLVGIGCLALLGYFAWHAWYGPRGMGFLPHLDAELTALRADLQHSTAQKDKLKSKVLAMRPENVDADLLDELTRSSLSWVGRDDLIVRPK